VSSGTLNPSIPYLCCTLSTIVVINNVNNW